MRRFFWRLYCWLRGRPTVRDTVSAILLTHKAAPEGVIASWTYGQRQSAWLWAMTEHFAAGDNDDVERLPIPPHVEALPDYGWRAG